jgi:hypothetical protein
VPQFEHPDLTTRLIREFIDDLPAQATQATAS